MEPFKVGWNQQTQKDEKNAMTTRDLPLRHRFVIQVNYKKCPIRRAPRPFNCWSQRQETGLRMRDFRSKFFNSAPVENGWLIGNLMVLLPVATLDTGEMIIIHCGNMWKSLGTSWHQISAPVGQGISEPRAPCFSAPPTPGGAMRSASVTGHGMARMAQEAVNRRK